MTFKKHLLISTTLFITSLTPFAHAGVYQDEYIKATNTDVDDFFGNVTAVDGDLLAVSAPYEESNATGIDGDDADNSGYQNGAVYLYQKGSGGNWVFEAYLKGNNTGVADFFGSTIDISGDTVVVGASHEDSTANNSGAVYVFTRSQAGVWSQQAFIKASNAGSSDFFGSNDIDIEKDTLAVSSYTNDSVYIFKRNENGIWSEQDIVHADNEEPGDFFGVSLSLSEDGHKLAVGDHWEDGGSSGINGDDTDNSKSKSGAVYLFENNGSGEWDQTAYIKASNTDSGDEFGFSVALSGDTLLVGAPKERSSSTGINGDETDNNSSQSGAAYVFKKTIDNGWTQEAYIKSSNSDYGDNFGHSVALHGKRALIGAKGEDSSTSGVNGNELDNSLSATGATYYFVKDDCSGWTQEAYLKASNPDYGDLFGRHVSISQDFLVVGARREDSSAEGVGGNESDNSTSNSGAVYVFTEN